jgi:hypothetical protein
MMLSTSSHYSMEDVARAATAPLWFQLYHRGYDLTKMLVQRAEHADFKAIVLTVDTPLPAPKERDIRNRYANPFPLGNFRATTDDLPDLSGTDEAPNWRPARVAPLTWKELDWLRSLTALLRSDAIQYRCKVVCGFGDIVACAAEFATVRSIVLVNCGGTADLAALVRPGPRTTIFVSRTSLLSYVITPLLCLTLSHFFINYFSLS